MTDWRRINPLNPYTFPPTTDGSCMWLARRVNGDWKYEIGTVRVDHACGRVDFIDSTGDVFAIEAWDYWAPVSAPVAA